ncbi:site-2 protease family protein [Ruminococcus sp.]|uniref:site-2 protease family protein n=1 Tax=Ruminococcus sp. TaxID=41978 RepID=UPI0025DD9B0D|nr:site-2 protease family protein [Ruminococcus sp.]MBQ6250779.1 site-2 protease family protein [Ruminococcus sp.]MBR6995177.1 site-2 protease family protein [Ruminococcus sp.]
MIGSGIDIDLIMMIAARAITFLLVIPIHESAHGIVAGWLGDDTAKKQGRITLNPFAHIDPLGFIMMLALGVGWAKPVPVDPSKFKHRRLGYALVSLAGPVSNFIAAFIGCLIFVISSCLLFGADNWDYIQGTQVQQAIFTLLMNFVSINVMLALFNLVPLPPMDGFNFLRAFMPASFDNWVFRNQRVLSTVFFGIIIIGSHIWQVRMVFAFIYNIVQWLIWMSVSWIPLLFK